MADQPTPADIATALQAKHVAFEGTRIPDSNLHQMLVDMAEWTVDNGLANSEPEAAIIEAVKNLALTAAKIPGFDRSPCDACDSSYDQEVLEAAEQVVPGSATLNDACGDPDVTTCGICNWEARNDPPDPPDEMSDAEWEAIVRAEEDDVRGDDL